MLGKSVENSLGLRVRVEPGTISWLRLKSGRFFISGPTQNRTALNVLHIHDVLISAHMYAGRALVEAGETYKQLAEIKYSMEDNVKQNFLEPLQNLQNKDLKEVNVCVTLVTRFCCNFITVLCC